MSKTRLSPATPKCRVFLVDDHPIVRQGLALFIDREPDLMVCGEAEGANSARCKRSGDSIPDFVVLDISLDGPDGLELLKTIRAKIRILPVLILSMHDESTYAERALRAGANGYIMKQEATEKVLDRDPPDTARRRLPERSADQARCCSNSSAARSASRSSREFERQGTRSLPFDRRRPRNAPDRRRTAHQHKDRRMYQAHIKEKLSLRNARELFSTRFNGR